MTREEASYILRKFYADGYKSNNYSNIEQALQLAVYYLENFPHWISVDDELPEVFDIVLYCDEDGNYYTEIDNIGQDVKITHWMHIPDCPPLQEFTNKLRAVLDGENEKGGEND